MDSEHFKAVCDLAFRLTELRQNECKSLCVENVSQEILEKLLEVYNRQVPVVKPVKASLLYFGGGYGIDWRPVPCSYSAKATEADARCS